MKLVRRKEMQAMDRAAIERYGISSLSLMENAGKGVADLILKEFFFRTPRRPEKSISVLCGKGNNGGDGFVVARYLKEAGAAVKVFVLAPEEDYGGDALVNLNRLSAPVLLLNREAALHAYRKELEDSFLIVDALFGTGLDRPIEGFAARLIRFLNQLRTPILSVDMPSGLCADTGTALGVAVRASMTATLHLPKLGLVSGPDSERAGSIRVIPIGIPEVLEKRIPRNQFLITPESFNDSFRPRPRDSHKGTYGHVLTVAGSHRKIGAALMAARSALRAGAGLSTLALPRSAYRKIDSRFAEVMFEPEADDGEFFSLSALPSLLKLLKKKSALACGPGMGVREELQKLIAGLLRVTRLPCVLDADALNNLSRDLRPLKKTHPPLILTPHPGEMARLIGPVRATHASPLRSDRSRVVVSFAKRYKVHLVLKGYRTLVGLPDGSLYVNSTGNPGMATAGAGDVLTGVIAGFLAQGLSPRMAALAGVWIHGRAGDLAAREKGEVGLVAWDLAEKVPYAIKEVMEG